MLQPAFDQARVNTPEIVGEFQVAISVQIGQRGRFAVVAAPYGFADDIHVIRSSMVCAQTCVLGDAAAEFGKN